MFFLFCFHKGRMSFFSCLQSEKQAAVNLSFDSLVLNRPSDGQGPVKPCWDKMMDPRTIPDAERIIYDLVTFENVFITYNRDEDVVVEFTLDPQMKASTRDWLGIYPAGWSSYESFVTYKWGIGDPINNSCRTRKIIFDPNDLIDVKPDRHYQFVYISQHLEIMGVSRFFQFCTTGFDDLDISKLSCSDIYNSTQYVRSPKKAKKVEKMKDAETETSQVTFAPTCSINLPTDLSKVCTVCSKCKQLFDLIELQEELKLKVETYAEKNEELQSRVVKLESALENMKLTNASLRDWNEELEKKQFQNFIEELRSRNLIDGKGDNKNYVVKSTFHDVQTDFYLDDFTNREIILKAIIGNQEVKIRELTKVICQSHVIDHHVFHALPAVVEDVVTVTHTDEKLLPELCEVNNNELVNSDEED
ncbi:calcium-binding and coiled-coil domain-containing protein 2-like isoform X1 [Cimex lectularius]|uniref:SKICH domain-containing protein n=2 Tax=Cimex lectularius TaxID=79782 RepID=A0A8I6S4Z9_CIMLE|nr:calcium-binding and coiled-coil domain-containing protein 2-like isoform X1 [Cimex lectularius]